MHDFVRWANIVKFIDDAGTPFDTSVFNTAIQSCNDNNWHTLYFPPGSYGFDQPPNAIDFGLNIRGGGQARTTFNRNYNTGGSALLSFIGGTGAAPEAGGGVQDLTINNVGSGAAYAIALTATGSRSPDNTLFRNLSVTGSAPWFQGMLINGLGKTTAPFGINNTRVENCHFSSNTSAAVVAAAAHHLEIQGGGAYGYAPASNIYIGGTATQKSRHVRIRTHMIGELNLTNAEEVFVNGSYGYINSASSANYVWVNGYKKVTTPDAWNIPVGRLMVLTP